MTALRKSFSQEINEGLARFDIVFYVRTKDGLSQIIINVEAQKDEPGEYEILNRAISYDVQLFIYTQFLGQQCPQQAV